EARKAYDAGRRSQPPVPVAKNLRMETLVDIIEGDILIHSHSYRADEILMLMRVFEDYDIKNYTFQHANEAFKIAPELRKHNAYTSVFADWWAYKFEVYYSTAFNASILNANGITNSINSDSGELIRHLNHEAAKTVHYGGTSKQDALKMITINHAKEFGIAVKLGGIVVGNQGEVAIRIGHPLSIYSKAEKTFIDGKKYFDREEDPDDMRLDVNAEAKFETAHRRWYNEGGRQGDACMQGAEIRFTQQGVQLGQATN